MSMIGNQVISTNFPVDYFSGNGSTTAFTLSIAPASVNALDVQVSGVSQSPQTYSVSGTTLTFSAAPPSGSSNIVVRHLGIAGIPNTPSVASVVTSSIASNAVTPAKMANGGAEFGYRNRIINGAMTVAQRGTSFTFSNAIYPVDRFLAATFGTVPTATISQSSTAPAGFINSILLSITTGQAVGSTDIHAIRQSIEGLNLYDLNYGNASAVTTTLSFWVRSSLIGNYTVAIYNPNSTKWYSQPYTINNANTWEQKTITVVGDTVSAMATNNTAGILIDWIVGAGSTYNGTASQSWSTTAPRQITGSQNITATTGATFYITGVQLEVGTTATNFDYRSYGTELALCQRYYFKTDVLGIGAANTTTGFVTHIAFGVPMRSTPTTVVPAGVSWVISDDYSADSTASTPTVASTYSQSSTSWRGQLGGFTGLTVAKWYGWVPAVANAIAFSAEL